MLVQALISEFAIQAFDKGVLSGLAWLDKAKLYACILRPEVHL